MKKETKLERAKKHEIKSKSFGFADVLNFSRSVFYRRINFTRLEFVRQMLHTFGKDF